MDRSSVLSILGLITFTLVPSNSYTQQEGWFVQTSGTTTFFLPFHLQISTMGLHMKTFYITGGLDKCKYVIAWEDWNLGDADYNDLVVEVYAVTPGPEPGRLALLGAGLIGLGGMGLHRRRRN